jgi:putative mRNA 3-end processing factor
VERAIITHAHSDHARPGSSHYLTHRTSVPLLHARLGTKHHQVQGVEYGEQFTINGVRFSLHPAGHVPGSAQILVEYEGERWVFSGDYKTEPDLVSTPFEPVRCNTFISECTFGLPVFSWRPQREVFDEIEAWWRSNRERGVNSVLCAYALGKAQRLISHINPEIGPIVLHSAVWNMTEALSMPMSSFERLADGVSYSGALIVAPPSIQGSSWLKRFTPYEVAVVSGWMAIRGIKRRRGVSRGFVLSDHADFAGLYTAIKATGAERVLLTHGYTELFGRWLLEQGTDATTLTTSFGDEALQEDEEVVS